MFVLIAWVMQVIIRPMAALPRSWLCFHCAGYEELGPPDSRRRPNVAKLDLRVRTEVLMSRRSLWSPETTIDYGEHHEAGTI